MLIVKYSIVRQNPSRKNCPWHGLVRQDGRKKYVPLNTTDKAVAERWLTEQRYRYDKYRAGELGEDEIITADGTPAIAQKGPSGAVSGKGDKLDGVIDKWERDMRLVGQREATIAAYTRTCRMLLDTSVILNHLTADMFKDALAAHAECKPATRRFYSNCLKALAAYLEEEKGLRGLRKGLPNVKADPTVRPVFSQDQMIAIISNVRCRDKVCEKQFRLYLSIMATVGCRQGELYELDWSDFQGDRLRFRAEKTKGRKERIVPIPEHLTKELMEMDRLRGRIFDAIPPSQGARDKMLRRAMSRAGIRAGSLHSFRKGVVEILMARCHDPKLVTQVTGHSPVTMVRYYQADRDMDRLKELVDG